MITNKFKLPKSDNKNESDEKSDNKCINKLENNKILNYEITQNIGFVNIGHTCYMNSFLQILLHTPTFLPKLKGIYNDKIGENTLIYNLIKLSEYPYKAIYLKEIKKIIAKPYPKYGLYIQNDTQKFGIDFIDTLNYEIKNETSFSSETEEEEQFQISDVKENIIYKKQKYKKFLSDCKKSGEKTLIEELFSFIDSKIRYNGELIIKNKVRFDLLFNLELTFPQDQLKEKYTLKELIDFKYNNYKKIIIEQNKNNELNTANNNQILKKNEETNSYFSKIKYFLNSINLFGLCHFCERKKPKNKEEIFNKINSITKSKGPNNESPKVISKLVSLPKILIMSFVRGIKGKNLITSSISFEEEIDLKDYIEKDLFNNNLGTKYKLYAINIREGQNKKSGHCYCYVKVKNDWICFNDSVAYKENPHFKLNSVAGLYYVNSDD